VLTLYKNHATADGLPRRLVLPLIESFKMKKCIVISFVTFIGFRLIWYFDPFHNPVESIRELENRDYAFALKEYFGTEPNEQYKISINKSLNEFHCGIIDKKGILLDSIVKVFTGNILDIRKLCG
jgi:hypothetical protein